MRILNSLAILWLAAAPQPLRAENRDENFCTKMRDHWIARLEHYGDLLPTPLPSDKAWGDEVIEPTKVATIAAASPENDTVSTAPVANLANLVGNTLDREGEVAKPSKSIPGLETYVYRVAVVFFKEGESEIQDDALRFLRSYASDGQSPVIAIGYSDAESGDSDDQRRQNEALARARALAVLDTMPVAKQQERCPFAKGNVQPGYSASSGEKIDEEYYRRVSAVWLHRVEGSD